MDVPEPGRVWAALTGVREQTGLMPVLLDGGEDEEDYFFHWPPKIAEVDRLDAGTVLAAFWDGQFEDTSGPAELYDTPLSREFLGLGQPPPGGHGLGDIASAIFNVMTDSSAQAEVERLNEIDRRNAVPLPFPIAEPDLPQPQPFPGLAPPADGRLGQAERDAALASLQPARLGGLRKVPDIAAALVGAPIWTFWWD